MSESDIILNDLEAFAVRQATGNDGIRVITGQDTTQFLPDWLENIGASIWELGTKLVGFAFGAIGSVFEFTFSKGWGAIVSYAQFAWNFNWDASDEQLDAILGNFKIQIASQVGGTLGNLAGYLVCGALPGLVMMKFNKMVAVRILKEVGEEALEELAGNLSALCTTAVNGFMQWYAINWFKCQRRMIKSFFNDPNSTQSRLGQRIFGNNFNNAVKGWGDGKDDWSFATLFEEAVDRIPIDWLRAGVEDFAEEFAESCIEAGYIVAGELDSWAVEKQTQREQVLGEQKVVEITPNREAENEKIILAGNEAILRATLPVVLSTHQQLENRDVGQWVGESLRENLLRAKKQLELKILLFSVEAPPYYPSNRKVTRVQITLPGVKRSALDWQRIKTAVGGTTGYLWGRFCCITKLVDDQDKFAGFLKVYGATPSEAEQITDNLLMLTDYRLISQNTVEEKKKGIKDTGRALEKESTKVYPGYVVVTNAQKVINETEGRATYSGAYKYKNNRLELYGKTKPNDWDEVIRELLSTPGADL